MEKIRNCIFFLLFKRWSTTLGSPESGNLPNRDIFWIKKADKLLGRQETFSHRTALQQASSTSTECTRTSFLVHVGVEENVHRALVYFITVKEQLS